MEYLRDYPKLSKKTIYRFDKQVVDNFCVLCRIKQFPTIALRKQKTGESKIQNDGENTKIIGTESKFFVHGIQPEKHYLGGMHPDEYNPLSVCVLQQTRSAHCCIFFYRNRM